MILFQISKYFGYRIQQQLLANVAHVQRHVPFVRRLHGQEEKQPTGRHGQDPGHDR